MTLEELRSEAKKQGYKLCKAQIHEKLLPCKCGYKRPQNKEKYIWSTDTTTYYFQCPKCGKSSIPRENGRLAKAEWNQMINMENSLK